MKFLRNTILILFLSTLGLIGVFNYSKTVKDHSNSIEQSLQQSVTKINDRLENYEKNQQDNYHTLQVALNNVNKNKISIRSFIQILDTLTVDVSKTLNDIDEQTKLRDFDLLKNINNLKKYYKQLEKDIMIVKAIKKNGYDKNIIYEKMLYPTVRIGVFKNINNGKFKDGIILASIGSGSIIYSKKRMIIDPDGNLKPSDHIDTYILTCSHLSDGLYGIDHFEIHTFNYEGNYKQYKADKIASTHSYFGKDIAILKLRNNTDILKEAEFISENKIKNLAIGIEIINVGAGLGIRPFPGFGYITGKYTEDRSLGFLWQTQTPGIFGNSGGPVFTKDGKQIGIIVRISITRRGNPMPHMSYFVPPQTIYNWLKRINLDHILAN